MSNQSFKVKSGLTLTPVDLAELLTPQAGDLACDINDNNKIKRYDANASSWVEVGSGGIGGVDIFFVQDFESASLSAFTQVGLSLSQTSPLHSKVSALLTHQAGTSPANDQYFKQVIAVDNKFRGVPMVLRLDSKSNASQGNVVIKIYDETNAVNIVASEQLQLSNDTAGKKTSVAFTIPATCSSISYTITALPEAGSPETRIDDIICEIAQTSLLETSVDVPVITEWKDAGQLIVTGQTTNPTKGVTTSDIVKYRQVGESYEVEVKYAQAAGTAGSGDYYFTLPDGIMFDTSVPKHTSAISGPITSAEYYSALSITASLDAVGRFGNATSGSYYNGIFILPYDDTRYRIMQAYATGTAYLLASDGTGFDEVVYLGFTFRFKGMNLTANTTKVIPLTQSGLVQEADSYLRLTNFTAALGSTANKIVTLISSTYQQNIGDAIQYLDDSISGARFIAQKDGLYRFEFSADLHATVGQGIGFSKNTSSTTTAFTSLPASEKIAAGYDTGSNNIAHVFAEAYLVAGDIIRIHSDATISSPSNGWATFTASYQGSLKQVSVSSDQKITIPTSELRFEGASARGSTATAIVQFTSLAKLRGDAFTVESDAVLGTRITMKKAGKLDINANVYLAAASSIAITKNQSNLTISTTSPASEILSTQGSNSTANRASASWSGFVNAGDIIRVASETAIASFVSNNLNLSFQEQEIAVSVTNTLPQFSESDSSVRLDTANGYGSTGTCIRRFSSVRSNIGNDIEYIPSAIDGDSFVVKSSGIYHVSYTDSQSGSNSAGMAITLNESSTSTSIDVLVAQPNNNILSYGRRYDVSVVTNLLVGQANWSGYLQAGDVIRAHTIGSGASDADVAKFTISKVGKPNVTGVDVTPFVNVPQPTTQSSYLYTNTSVSSSNAVTGALTRQIGSDIFSYNSTTGIYTVLKKGLFNLAYSNSAVGNSITATVIVLDDTPVTYNNTQSTATASNSTSYTDILLVGQKFYFRPSTNAANNHSIAVTASALSDQILTAPETFSTDTASLRYANASEYTLSTLQNAPVGTYITFTYAANTNTRTQTTLTNRPSQTDADMNVNGIQLFTRAYNAPSTSGNPSAIAIQIGKGLKGRSLDLYKSVGKDTSGSLDVAFDGTFQRGAYSSYSEITGVLLIDAGKVITTNATNVGFEFSDTTTATSGYLVINASKAPYVVGFGIANNTEAAAGVISDKFITPKTLKGGLNASGDAPVYAARAWVNFNGTGTVAIRSSGNVSSITDNGTGDYTINFTTALPDTNYTFVGSSSSTSGDTTVFQPTVNNAYGLNVSNLRINCRGQDRTTLADPAQVMIAIFR